MGLFNPKLQCGILEWTRAWQTLWPCKKQMHWQRGNIFVTSWRPMQENLRHIYVIIITLPHTEPFNRGLKSTLQMLLATALLWGRYNFPCSIEGNQGTERLFLSLDFHIQPLLWLLDSELIAFDSWTLQKHRTPAFPSGHRWTWGVGGRILHCQTKVQGVFSWVPKSSSNDHFCK